MINNNVFDYINVLDKAADASWKRNEAIANNIANQSTPGYKRQDVAFESELKKALGKADSTDMDMAVAKIRTSKLKGKAYTDMANLSYRLDGNNVDVDNEQVMLAENQIKYQGLTLSLNQEFANLKMVMK